MDRSGANDKFIHNINGGPTPILIVFKYDARAIKHCKMSWILQILCPSIAKKCLTIYPLVQLILSHTKIRYCLDILF
jgi:hypothetical protein